MVLAGEPSRQFFEGFLRRCAKLRTQASNATETQAQGWNKVFNAMSRASGQMMETSGASKFLTDRLNDLAIAIDNLPQVFGMAGDDPAKIGHRILEITEEQLRLQQQLAMEEKAAAESGMGFDQARVDITRQRLQLLEEEEKRLKAIGQASNDSAINDIMRGAARGAGVMSGPGNPSSFISETERLNRLTREQLELETEIEAVRKRAQAAGAKLPEKEIEHLARQNIAAEKRRDAMEQAARDTEREGKRLDRERQQRDDQWADSGPDRGAHRGHAARDRDHGQSTEAIEKARIDELENEETGRHPDHASAESQIDARGFLRQGRRSG